MFSQATLLMALAASANAHMILNYPIPYGKATLNSSPLGPGDFPCKQRTGVYDVTQMNQWNAGETQTISFTGSAVHGGGSCQFSLTTDMKPTANSDWKVIHSVIGGCPSNVTGNLPVADPNGHGAATFPVTMPKDIPDGQYTFAWTWLNKVGNREFYMNCAPVQVGSGSGSANTASAAQALKTLPEMFVANIPGKCTIPENLDFKYPNPGQSVVTEQGAATTGSDALYGQCGATSGGQPSSPSQPAGSQPAASAKPSATAPASQAPSQPSGTAPSYQAPSKSATPVNPGNPGGVFAPGASSAPASAPTAQPAPIAAPSAKPETPKNPPKNPDNNTAPASGDCTPCTNDGAVVCIGSKQFGLCNRGCAVAQDLAQGMACTNGVVVAATKRHVFPRAHLHRRFSAARFL